MESARNREDHTIIISQKNYIEKVLKWFNMGDYKLVGTLFDANFKLLKLSDEDFET